MSYMSDGAKDKIDDFFDPKLIKKLILLLVSNNASIVIPCLRTIGNMLTGSDDQTQVVVENGLV